LIRVRTSGDLTGIRDPHRLRQLIANLLGNALEHGSPSDPVDLTAHDLLTGASPHKNENLGGAETPIGPVFACRSVNEG